MAHMASTCIIVLLFVMIFYTTTISAFNITKILSDYPEFSTFNDLLTKIGLAENINERSTITVLVVDNSLMGSITNKPENTIKKIISTHALLEYFDMNTLSMLPKSGQIATNFFQNSGVAEEGQGQTRVTTSGYGGVVFGSNVVGAVQDARMVKVVVTQQPYIVSVIQLAQPIVTPGLDQGSAASPKAAPPAKAMAPSPKAENVTEKVAPAEAPAKVAPAAGPAKNASEGPAKVAPAEGPVKVADSPVSESPSVARKLSPGYGPGPGAGPAPALSPEDGEDEKDSPPKLIVPKNGGTQLTAGVVAAFMGLLALSL